MEEGRGAQGPQIRKNNGCPLAAVVLLLVIVVVNVDKPCAWCQAASCLPVHGWCRTARLP